MGYVRLSRFNAKPYVSGAVHFVRDEDPVKNKIMVGTVTDTPERPATFIEFPADKAVRMASEILSVVGENHMPEAGEGFVLAPAVQFDWTAYEKWQMGRGLVGPRSEDRTDADAHEAFVHLHAESEDPIVQEQVENDCLMLAHLLQKFAIMPSFLSEVAFSRGKQVPVKSHTES